MQKTAERLRIEAKIRRRFKRSYKKARVWMILGLPLLVFGEERFLRFMSQRVRRERLAWLKAVKELEELETTEGFPAMHAYTDQLREIGSHLPKALRIGYYPFSGPDIYWGSIFPTLVLEDVNFGTAEEHHPTMWWDRETYSLGKCVEIEALLKEIGILRPDADIRAQRESKESRDATFEQSEKAEVRQSRSSYIRAQRESKESEGRRHIRYLKGNSEESREDNDFNRAEVALICKSGDPFARFLEKRFGEGLNFGAIIVAHDPTPREKLDALLASHGYKHVFSFKGEAFLVPFAQTLGNVDLYLKEES